MMPLAWKIALWLALFIALVSLLGGCASRLIVVDSREPEYVRLMRFTMNVGPQAILEQTWAERTPEKPAQWPIQ